MSRYSHLLFHTFAELFAISVGLMAFVVAWSAYPSIILRTGFSEHANAATAAAADIARFVATAARLTRAAAAEPT